MSASLNKVSTLIESQLPAFIVDDHPNFVEFIKKYYEFLEQPGNPVYELKVFDTNYDVDLARESMITYFKSKIIPSFPEQTALSSERILKASKDFYAKKGTPDSFKFIFKALYNTDVEVFFPKLQILRASDGKWMQPQAFRLSLSPQNEGFDVNLLEKKKGYGSLSRASCVIEQANMTFDTGTNKQMIEIYISSLNRFFAVGEYLEVEYYDENGEKQVFSERIIGALSNILLKKDRNGFTIQGLKYRTGDPVVINGGSPSIKAVAYVGDVTSGSIDSVYVIKGGYGFRTYANTLIDISSSTGVGANVYVSDVTTQSFTGRIGDATFPYLTGTASANLYVISTPTHTIKPGMAVFGDGVADRTIILSQLSGSVTGGAGTYQISKSQFVPPRSMRASDTVAYSTDSILYLKDRVLGSNSTSLNNITLSNVSYTYSNLTIGSGNTVSAINLSTTSFLTSTLGVAGNNIPDFYKSMVVQIISGQGYTATPNASIISSYDSNTKIATLEYALGAQAGATSNIAIYANSNTQLLKAFSFDYLELAPIETVKVYNGGSAFEEEPLLNAVSLYDTDYTKDQSLVSTNSLKMKKYEATTLGVYTAFYNKTALTITLNNQSSLYNNFSTANNYYLGWRMFIKSNDTAYQFRTITSYVYDSINNTKTMTIDRIFERNVNNVNFSRYDFYLDPRPNVSWMGRIANIEIISGGSGYTATDNVTFIGTGCQSLYGDKVISGTVYRVFSLGTTTLAQWQARFSALASVPTVNQYITCTSTGTIQGNAMVIDAATIPSISVGAAGEITAVNIPDKFRGEGYPVAPTILVSSSTGSGAVLKAYLYGDAEEFDVVTSSIGKIKNINLVSRGYDYLSTPSVSLKIYDVLVDTLDVNNPVYENDFVYQKDLSGNFIFRGNVDSHFAASEAMNNGLLEDTADTTHDIIRVFNYSGAPIVDTPLYVSRYGYPGDEGYAAVTSTYVRSKSIDIIDPTDVTLSVLYTKTYPWHYGNGKAKAVAYFLNGLIKYNGYYLNTDGHISSDKRIQDGIKYHNYSYSLISEVPYSTYYKTILDNLHPIGTKLIPVMLHQYGQKVADKISINVDTDLTGSLSNNIDSCNVVFGTTTVVPGDASENFDLLANTGDIIVINPDGDYSRSFTKLIKRVGYNQLQYSQDFSTTWTRTRSDPQTNLLTYSQTFDNAVWTTAELTRTSGQIAPDGSNTAYSFVETTTPSATHTFNYTTPPSLIANGVYTASIRVKWLSGSRYIELRGGNNTGINKGVKFNSSGEFVSYTGGSNGTINSYSSVQGTNGWWTFSITFTSAATTSTGSGLFIYFYSGTNATYTGDGTSGVYLWGAQLVQGSAAGDYMATTSAALPILYTDPESTKTAQILASTTATGYVSIAASSITVGQSYIVSTYIKAGSVSKFWFYNNSTATNGNAFFDISSNTTNVVTGSGGQASNLTITSAGNGWYRISATFSALGSSFGGGPTTSMSSPTCAAGDYIYLWGWQVRKAADGIGEYYPTTSSAITSEQFTIESLCVKVGDGRANIVLRDGVYQNNLTLATKGRHSNISNITIEFSPPNEPLHIKTFPVSSNVSLSANTINVYSHNLSTGNTVVYMTNGNPAISGLTTNTVYYVIKVDSNTIKLANTYSRAISAQEIDLASLGSGTHTIIKGKYPTAYVTLKDSISNTDIYVTNAGTHSNAKNITVTFSNPTNGDLKANAYVKALPVSVANIIVDYAGTGYTDKVATITFSEPGNATNATAILYANLNSFVITDAGAGYGYSSSGNTNPTITIKETSANVNATVTFTAINSYIQIVNNLSTLANTMIVGDVIRFRNGTANTTIMRKITNFSGGIVTLNTGTQIYSSNNNQIYEMMPVLNVVNYNIVSTGYIPS